MNSTAPPQDDTRLARALDTLRTGFWEYLVGEDRFEHLTNVAALSGYDYEDTPHDLATLFKNAHPDDAPRLHAIVDDMLAGTTLIFDVEYRSLHRDGSWRWFHSRGSTLTRDPSSGRPTRISGLLSDITAEKVRDEEGHPIIAMCMHCKRVRHGGHFWERIEQFIMRQAHARLTHGLCADCLREHYPDYRGPLRR